MKNLLKNQLIEFIIENEKVRPADLVKFFKVSSVAIHRQLRKLLENNEIVRSGRPPLVFYSIPSGRASFFSGSIQVDERTKTIVEERYVYISPNGKILYGLEGFAEWVLGLGLQKQFPKLIAEYINIREEADRFFKPGKKLIEATEKLQNTFQALHLDKVFYQDFYSLPKFGKTKLGTFVLYAKQSQNLELMRKIAAESAPVIRSLIKGEKIDTVAFIPHSIPRRIPFLKEFERMLQLPLQRIETVKAYTGEVQVPQKSLSKLEERIVNARDTFFLKKNPVHAKRVLLIDDAVGSGATMNEVAKMIRDFYKPKSIVGFAVVGSYKGFEVIREA